MSIDWITVAAQIVNFLVLVWLLKRFLYRPILDGIDAREREIAERMGEAAQIRTAAEAAEADYEAQVASLRAGREGALEEARKAPVRCALVSEVRAAPTVQPRKSGSRTSQGWNCLPLAGREAGRLPQEDE